MSHRQTNRRPIRRGPLKRRAITVAMMAALLLFALGATTVETAAQAPAPHSGTHPQVSGYDLAPFGTVSVYRPKGDVRGVVLFLSGDAGWNEPLGKLAATMTQEGLLVAAVSTPALMKALEAGSTCIDPHYALIDLARDVQHRAAVRSYMKPTIIGFGSGATLAYGSIAQWPNPGYQAVISIDFTPILRGRKPWCKAPGFVVKSVERSNHGWAFAPRPQMIVPWTMLQGRFGGAFTEQQALHFVSSVSGATLVQVPGNPHDLSANLDWSNHLRSIVTRLLPPPPLESAAGQVPIPDMHINLVSAAGSGPNDVMAIMYSGDGGWASLDHDVAAQLAAAGIPVVGVDSLSYFWSARTPKGAAADLAQLMAAFSQRWKRPKILLVGYSFGADALPYIVDNLDPTARSRIDSVTLMGLSSTASFQFHLATWLNMSSGDELPTLPATSRLKGISVRCIRGATEPQSACPAIPTGIAQQFIVPGDHHFNRNAFLLSRIILGQRRPGVVGK